MKLADFTSIVQNNINDATENVDQEVTDAVNELSRYIQIVTSSEETLSQEELIARPPEATKILRIYIPEKGEIFELKRKEIAKAIEKGELGFWQDRYNIHFTKNIMAITETIIITYKKTFQVPTETTDFDGPDFLTEIITTIATEKYYRKLISKKIQETTTTTTTLNEIIQGWEVWNRSKNELLRNLTRFWETMYDSGFNSFYPTNNS